MEPGGRQLTYSLFRLSPKEKPMAASTFQSRSNSLPSTPHPLTSLVDEQLSRLQTSESASASTSLNQKLSNLQDLHDSSEKLLLLQSAQQTLGKEDVDELLNGSLSLLDLCNCAKDTLLQTRESMQEIQSILRRRRGSEMELAKEVKIYFSSKKTMRKTILKALKNLQHIEKKQNTSSHEPISIFGEVEAASFRVLESLLSFIAGPEAEKKKSHWSYISKLLRNKGVKCEEEDNLNEIASAEATLLSLINGGSNKINMEIIRAELQKSESCIQDFEEGIDGLSRCLIKTRVTLLNILN